MSIYGIDLGTTNSLIGLYSKKYLSDLIPSCVDINTGECGKSMFERMDAKRSFKVDMSMGKEGNLSRVASSYVLKELCKQVSEKVTDVVISVPAYFTDNQRQATLDAARMAGLEVHGLINEPTAAAMYIAQKKESLFAVFDLGGGTFDISIIDSRFGTYDVQASSGCMVGGDDFDNNIMRYFVKQGNIKLFHLDQLAKNALKHYASKIKIKMQKEQKPFDVNLKEWGGTDITFTPDIYIELMKMTFNEAMQCAVRLIHAYIPEDEVYEVLPVGGSTRCPYLRKWLHEELHAEVTTLTYDPDRVVAQGAAYYAHLIENQSVTQKVSDVTRALSISCADGTADIIVEANSKIPLKVERMFYNFSTSSALELALYQGESTFASENEHIGTLVWEYDEVKPAMEGQVIVTISIDSKGIITFQAGELLKEPKTLVLDRSSC